MRKGLGVHVPRVGPSWLTGKHRCLRQGDAHSETGFSAARPFAPVSAHLPSGRLAGLTRASALLSEPCRPPALLQVRRGTEQVSRVPEVAREVTEERGPA